MKKISQTTINKIDQSLSRIMGVICLGTAVFWFANFPPKGVGFFYFSLLIFSLFWWILYWVVKVLLWMAIGRPRGGVETKQTSTSLLDLWPEINTFEAAKRHVKRGIFGVGTIIAIQLIIRPLAVINQKSIISGIFLLGEIGLWGFILWGMRKYFRWAGILAVGFWVIKSALTLPKHLNIMSIVFSLVLFVLLIHGLRGIIVVNKFLPGSGRPS
jgi:hypothetical protein